MGRQPAQRHGHARRPRARRRDGDRPGRGGRRAGRPRRRRRGVWVANRQAQTLARIDPERAVVTRAPAARQRAARARDGRRPGLGGGRRDRGGPSRRHAAHRSWTVADDALDLDPADGYDLNSWMLLQPRLRRADRVPAHRRQRRARSWSRISRSPFRLRRTAGTDVHVRAPAAASGSRPARQVRPERHQAGHRAFAERRARGVWPARRDQVDRGRRREPTLVIRLERPDPDFPYRLALPFAAAVPPGTARSRRASCPRRAPTGSLRSTGGTSGSSATPLPGVVAARQAGRLSGRDRRPLRHRAGRGRRRRSAAAAADLAFVDQVARSVAELRRARSGPGPRRCTWGRRGCSSTRACRRSTAPTPGGP